MIPKCKTWNVKAIGHDGKAIATTTVTAPNKVLARLNLAHERPDLLSRESINHCTFSVAK